MAVPRRREVAIAVGIMTVRRCRYLVTGKHDSLDRCTAEAVDSLGEILLCTHHLALALELLRSAGLGLAAL